MKKCLCILCVLALLLPCIPPAAAEEDFSHYDAFTNRQIAMRPDESWDSKIDAVSWYCDAPEVVSCSGSVLLAKEVGFATLIATLPDGTEYGIDVTVSENAMPMLIRGAVELALQEWEDHLGKTFSQKNKYTAWWCGTGPKCYFGWCGGFVSYCLDTAGVPMEAPADSVPHESGEPYATYATGVGKILKGFENMDRVSMIPRPGYLVIYGERGYYNTMHVGMVTDVQELGEGLYSIQTVEGNVSSRIKRYSYYYNANDTTEHNISNTPEEYRLDPDTYQYTIHEDNWFIHAFCQTWF